MLINDKSVPPAIKRFQMTVNLVLLLMIALSSTEFAIIRHQLAGINQNFNLIYQSYSRMSELMRIAFDVRALLQINDGTFTTYKGYTSVDDFPEFLKGDMEEALNNLYGL